MIIKKFVGKTEEEATAVARKELGAGVVVMNAKQIKNKGLFAFVRPKLWEVTVALEEEQEKFSAVKKAEVVTPGVQGVKEPERKLSEDARSIEAKLENLQTLLENQIKASEQSAKAEDAEKKPEEKEAEGKAEEIAEPSEEKEDDFTKFTKLIYNTLVDNEVDEKYANLILDEMDKVYKPNMPMDHILAGIYQRMILKFGKTAPILDAKEGPKVVMFFGPTGVGKTTTIAKVASRYAVEDKKKVAMLTADTYRIAAAEQLRTYANILQVPFRVIYTETELVNAVKDFYDYDYIFVDTAGHAHTNADQISNMKTLINALDGVAEFQAYLVLSATTKYRDLIRIADSYKEVCDYQLIFTKLDETFTLGNLYNIKMHTGSSIAYVTCGQNVPDDIEVFNPQKTVKILLGGKKQ